MEGREIPEMLMKTQKCCTTCCYWEKFVSCWSWGLHWQIPENARQWIWEMSDATKNKGMHYFHYSKAVLLCTYHPIKLWDKTGIWSLCFIESILHLRGVSWGISEPWVNILCLGALLTSQMTWWNTFRGSLSFQPFLNGNRCLRNTSPACHRQLHHCLGNNWLHLCFLHGTNWQCWEKEKEQEELPKHPHGHSEWV